MQAEISLVDRNSFACWLWLAKQMSCIWYRCSCCCCCCCWCFFVVWATKRHVALLAKTSHHIHLCATSVITIKTSELNWLFLPINASCGSGKTIQNDNNNNNFIDYYIRADMRTAWNVNVLHAHWKGGSQTSQWAITAFMTD